MDDGDVPIKAQYAGGGSLLRLTSSSTQRAWAASGSMSESSLPAGRDSIMGPSHALIYGT
jgi:hypothetical protein